MCYLPQCSGPGKSQTGENKKRSDGGQRYVDTGGIQFQTLLPFPVLDPTLLLHQSSEQGGILRTRGSNHWRLPLHCEVRGYLRYISLDLSEIHHPWMVRKGRMSHRAPLVFMTLESENESESESESDSETSIK